MQEQELDTIYEEYIKQGKRRSKWKFVSFFNNKISCENCSHN
jgi:hypothetical protein